MTPIVIRRTRSSATVAAALLKLPSNNSRATVSLVSLTCKTGTFHTCWNCNPETMLLTFCLSVEWPLPSPSIHEYYLFPEPIFSNKNGSHVGLLVLLLQPPHQALMSKSHDSGVICFYRLKIFVLDIEIHYIIIYVRSHDHRSTKCPHLRTKFNPDKLCKHHLRKPVLWSPRTRCCRFISLWTYVDLDLLDLFYKKSLF